MNNQIKNAKILIVEDEPQINRLIELVLISDGFCRISKAFDGEEALKLVYEDKPDLIILDVMLPEIDGFEVCKRIKNNSSLKNVQILMLTARKMEEDILEGFANGAIDYITKPFSNKVLLARIKAHLGNANVNYLSKIYKDIVLDSSKKTVKINNQTVILTNYEFGILDILMSKVGVVFSRSQLLQYLRGDGGFEISERAVDVQIVNLRRKLGEFGKNIETVRAVGYKLKEY